MCGGVVVRDVREKPVVDDLFKKKKSLCHQGKFLSHCLRHGDQNEPGKKTIGVRGRDERTRCIERYGRGSSEEARKVEMAPSVDVVRSNDN